MAIAQYDFVEIDYVGTIKASGKVFDVTKKADAKKHDLYNEKSAYAPRLIGVGLGYVIRGLDAALLGKEIGKSYTVDIASADAFGPRDKKLLQVVATKVLLAQKIRPAVGLTIYAGNRIGTIRSVAGGRCTVDFNHPLAGKDLSYTFTIVAKVDDLQEKVSSLLGHGLHLAPTDFTLSHDKTKKTLSIVLKKPVPEAVQKNFVALCAKIFSGLTVSFSK